MSRHRMVRNLVEDDYYDDYDDEYYEEEHDNTYTAPPKATPPAPPKTNTFTAQIAVPGKTAITASVGVVRPPPGWGRPDTTTTTPSKTSESNQFQNKVGGGSGIAKPPPGWGKPISAPDTSKKIPVTNSTTATFSPKPRSPKLRGNNATVTTPYKAKPVPDVVLNSKSQLSMVILGHVDAGKSTLMGQILVSTGQVTKRYAAKQGNLSWLLDENESERARGVTMEIGTKTLRTPHHDIVVLDAPGHHDFIPVMITGAANCDVAILVVAAVTGEFEAGFTGGGQTKEHILLARGLGVSQVVVAINKLDVEGWNEERYEQIQREVEEYLLKQEFKPKRIQFVPISGLTGENVEARTDTVLSRWYDGPTLLEAVDNFQSANRNIEKPLRFIVTDVFGEGKGVVTRGRVVQGFLEIGDKLAVLPVGDIVTVTKLEHLQAPSDDTDDPKRLDVAIAGDTVELVFNDIDIMRLSVGNILSFPDARPPLTKKARAKLLVMDKLTVPIIRGAQVIFHMHSLDVPAVLTKLIATLKRDGIIQKERPRALTSGASATVELTLSDRIVMEAFTECRALGRFVLRRGGDTIAIGVIDETL